jgi:GNAT superfamily N-acetyltransferase
MIRVDEAAAEDIDTVVAFIHKKADFDRAIGTYSGEIAADAPAIAKAILGTPSYASALIAREADSAVGFAFYHFRFSSYAARPSLWLDDLYVDAAARRHGVGARLMGRLAEIAAAHECSHLGWNADERNEPAMRFYAKLGATRVGQDGPSVTWRIAPDVLLAATES